VVSAIPTHPPGPDTSSNPTTKTNHDVISRFLKHRQAQQTLNTASTRNLIVQYENKGKGTSAVWQDRMNQERKAIVGRARAWWRIAQNNSGGCKQKKGGRRGERCSSTGGCRTGPGVHGTKIPDLANQEGGNWPLETKGARKCTTSLGAQQLKEKSMRGRPSRSWPGGGRKTQEGGLKAGAHLKNYPWGGDAS